MYVCLCKGVTDRTVRETIRAGNHTAEDVARACGAGNGCGCCMQDIEELIDDELMAEADSGGPLARLRCRRRGMSVTFLHSQTGEASGT